MRSEDASPHREPNVTRRRPTLLAAAAMTAVAVLSLSACGGGDDGGSKGEEKIEGAGQGSEEKSPSPSAPEGQGAERPKIELPGDVSNTFTPEKAGDPVQDEILGDNAEFVRSLDAAIAAGDPELPALAFYTEGEAAASAHQWVKSFKDKGLTITGTTRYYDRKVKVSSKTTASLTYCADESKAFTKDIKTKKVKETKVTKDSYVVYGAQVRKNKDGVWELIKMSSTRGAAVCRP
ncbi:lipoprotein [Streptomyces aureoverticillatus]|nr:lipoprotein [Streptomyces aureoverticillatus]